MRVGDRKKKNKCTHITSNIKFNKVTPILPIIICLVHAGPGGEDGARRKTIPHIKWNAVLFWVGCGGWRGHYIRVEGEKS